MSNFVFYLGSHLTNEVLEEFNLRILVQLPEQHSSGLSFDIIYVMVKSKNLFLLNFKFILFFITVENTLFNSLKKPL